MNDNCTICGEPHNGSGVGTGNGGMAHRWCYAKEHPPQAALDLHQVARGSGDPVLAAAVIAAMVPDELGERIVAEFNAQQHKNWERRCKP